MATNKTRKRRRLKFPFPLWGQPGQGKTAIIKDTWGSVLRRCLEVKEQHLKSLTERPTRVAIILIDYATIAPKEIQGALLSLIPLGIKPAKLPRKKPHRRRRAT